MRYIIIVAVLILTLTLSGCPFGSNNDPEPKESEQKQLIETLKIDWDSCSVQLKQSSRTIPDAVNMISITSADGCWGCANSYALAFITEDQCGREGWECTNRGRIKIDFSDIEIGKYSSLGYLINKGGKMTISTIDGSVLFSGATPTKNYRTNKIEIESYNNSYSGKNGDIIISTPECPAVNQNSLFQTTKNINEGNKQQIYSKLLKSVSERKWALALKIVDLNRWCESNLKPNITVIKKEKFTNESPRNVEIGKGEFIGQDLADLLIEDSGELYDYGKNSTYYWKHDEVVIKSPTVTKVFYKRGITDEKKGSVFSVAEQLIHFKNNDSLFVLINGHHSFWGPRSSVA